MIVAREDLALEAAFWAQLPGNFAMRPRKAPITSRNFAAMAPFHNYPVGPCARQSLGRCADAADHQRALAVLLLAACERSARSGRRQPQGHRPHLHLRARPDPARRCSSAFWSRCWRGRVRRRSSSTRTADWRSWCARSAATYLPLKNGVPTGFNPLQLPATPSERRVPEGLAARAGAPRPATLAALTTRGGRSRSGAARHAGARAVERGGCRGSSSSSTPPTRKACTRACARWCASHARATTPGCSTTPRTSSSQRLERAARSSASTSPTSSTTR